MKRPAYLKWIRTLPCLACGDDTSTEAAHVRMTDRSVAKDNPGMGQKPDDCFVVPLCGQCHSDQHICGEEMFWTELGIDAVKVALALYAYRDNPELAMRLVRAK